MICGRDKHQRLGFLLGPVAIFSENRVAANSRGFECNHGVARFNPVGGRQYFGRSGLHGRFLWALGGPLAHHF
jgi:hypothetical protein